MLTEDEIVYRILMPWQAHILMMKEFQRKRHGRPWPEQVMKKDADAEGEQREFELCFMAIRLFFGNNCLIPMMVRVFPIACVLVAACMPEAVLGREMGPDPLKSLQYDLKEGNKIVEKAIYLLKSVRERPRLDSDVRDEFDKATVTVLKIDARNVMMVTGRTRYSPELLRSREAVEAKEFACVQRGILDEAVDSFFRDGLMDDVICNGIMDVYQIMERCFWGKTVFHEDGRKGAFSLLPPCLFEYLAVSVSRHVEEVRSILKKAGAGEGDQEVVKELWKKDFSLWDIQNLA
ncbi:hypothetical protein, partial [Akkermansia sp.]